MIGVVILFAFVVLVCYRVGYNTVEKSEDLVGWKLYKKRVFKGFNQIMDELWKALKFVVFIGLTTGIPAGIMWGFVKHSQSLSVMPDIYNGNGTVFEQILNEVAANQALIKQMEFKMEYMMYGLMCGVIAAILIFAIMKYNDPHIKKAMDDADAILFDTEQKQTED